MIDERNISPLIVESATEDDVREVLRAGVADAPSQAQLDRLATRVAPVVGLPLSTLAGAPPPVGPPPAGLEPLSTSVPPGPAAPFPTGAKLVTAKLGTGTLVKVVGLMGAIGLGVVGWMQRTPAAPEAPAGAHAPAPPASLPAEPQAEPLQGEGRGKAVPRADDGVPATVRAPAPGPVERPRAVMRRASPPTPRPAKARAHRNVARGAPERAAPEAAPADRPSELALMDRAQALRSRPRRMLEVLRRHARLYRSGALAQEREALRIEGLVELGRRAEAERRYEAMQAAHPGSPHLHRVRALLQSTEGSH